MTDPILLELWAIFKCETDYSKDLVKKLYEDRLRLNSIVNRIAENLILLEQGRFQTRKRLDESKDQNSIQFKNDLVTLQCAEDCIDVLNKVLGDRK